MWLFIFACHVILFVCVETHYKAYINVIWTIRPLFFYFFFDRQKALCMVHGDKTHTKMQNS